MITDSINISSIKKSIRLNAGFYLSEAEILERRLSKFKIEPLKFFINDIYTAGRSKRNYCSSEIGIPFLGNTDISASNPLDSCNYISPKYWKEKKGMLKPGMILTGRVGQNTVGSYTYATELHDNCVGSDNVIRILINGNFKVGYIYSYLSSKYGCAFSRKHISGNAQPFVTEDMLSTIPIPFIADDLQNEIHDLIVESAKLRVEANNLRLEAIGLIENTLPTIDKTNQYVASISDLSKNNLRFDASTNYTNIELFYNKLSPKYNLHTIEELSENVFTPNIFKRLRVDNPDFGIPFLSGSDLLDAMPTFNSFLSKRMKNIDDYILRNGWIAIQDAGTIGYVTLVNGYLDGVAATNNLVRIVPKANSSNYYIYAFLKSKQGQVILKSYEYGSVQKHIDNNQVSQIKIPILPEYEVITNKISDYLRKTTEACYKENQAIQLVENEIARWQH